MNEKKEIEQSVVINKITIIQSLSICSVKFMPKQIEQFTETKAKRNRRTITINQSAVENAEKTTHNKIDDTKKPSH